MYEVVGVYAKLGRLLVGIVHGHSRETNGPAVGQRTGEGHARTAAGMVTDNLHHRQRLHVHRKLVGGTEHMAVGQQYHWLVPSQVGRGFQIAGFHVREVAVSRARLVLNIAYEHFLVGESRRQLLYVSQVAAAILADVDDQPPAQGHVQQHLVDVAVADGRREALVAYVANVVIENLIVQSTGYLVVGTHVAAVERVAVVGGVVLVPGPVACEVVRR